MNIFNLFRKNDKDKELVNSLENKLFKKALGLIKNGASVNTLTKNGASMIEIALSEASSAKYLIDNYGSKEALGKFKLAHQVAVALVNNGAEINIHSQYHNKPLLYLAFDMPTLFASNFLFDNKVDINYWDEGDSPLLYISSIDLEYSSTNFYPEKCFIVAKRLVEKGADVNFKDNYGATPLWHAALEGHIDIAKLLIDNGANKNVVSNNGRTPLSCAIDRGHQNIVRILEQ